MHRTALFALAVCLADIACSQAPAVVSTDPPAHGTIGPFDPIRVTFAAPIDPATATPFSFSVFGRSTGAVEGSVSVDVTQTVLTFQPSRPLFVGDAVRISLASTITSPQNAPLAGGYHFECVVQAPPGSGTFTLARQIPFRTLNEGPIRTYGVHGGDVDRDGSPDITAINEDSHDIRVLKNGGCGYVGPMTIVQDGANKPSPQDSADFDRDGWIDLVTGDYLFGNLSVFMNDGQGNYQPPLTLAGGSYVRSVAVGDFNGDGWPDVAAGDRPGTLVWLNDGNGGFLPATRHGPSGAAEINVVDLDEDGISDIVAAAFNPGRLWVLIGNGDGTFTANSTSLNMNALPWASTTGDIDGDGHADVLYACRGPDVCQWYLGDGNGGLTFGGMQSAPGFPTSIRLGDLEGDGDLDAVLSRFNGADFVILTNDGSASFAPLVSLPSISSGSCTTIVDFDRDGDLDIIGVDELADVGLVFLQTEPPIINIQKWSCEATARINQRGAGDGFGPRPPVPVRLGATMAVGMSGAPAAFVILLAASPSAVPFSSPFGLINFNLNYPTTWLAAAPLDAHGELQRTITVPSWTPLNFGLCVQGAVMGNDGPMLSNPVRFVAVP